MRIGLYIADHFPEYRTRYLRELILVYMELLAEPGYLDEELVIYSSPGVLSERMREDLSLASVLVSEARFLFDLPASSHFRRLPNGARVRVLARCGSKTMLRLALGALSSFDGVDVLHVIGEGAPRLVRCPVIAGLLEGSSKGALPVADLLVAESRRLAVEVGAERGMIAVVPAGVARSFERDRISFSAGEIAERSQLLSSLKLEEGYVLTTSHLSAQAVRCWARLPEELKRLGLVVLAENREKEVFQTLGAEQASEQIFIFPETKPGELKHLICGAGCVLFADPTVTLHALACGVPTLSTAVFDQDLHKCDPSDVEGSLGILREVLETPRNAQGARSRGRQIRSFPLMIDAVKRTYELYKQLAVKFSR